MDNLTIKLERSPLVFFKHINNFCIKRRLKTKLLNRNTELVKKENWRK